MTSIDDAMQEFIAKTYRSRATKTAQSYELAVKRFAKVLKEHRKNPATVDVSELQERWIIWLYQDTKDLKPTSEDLYATAVRQFYKYVTLADYAEINLAKLAEIMRDNRRRNGHRQARVDLEQLQSIVDGVAASKPEGVGELRDRALIYTLATTGLRLHEALDLTIADVDFEHRQTTLIGKGDREDTVFWSPQTLQFIRDYLDTRNVPASDPLFVAARNLRWSERAQTGGFMLDPFAAVTAAPRSILEPPRRDAVEEQLVTLIDAKRWLERRVSNQLSCAKT